MTLETIVPLACFHSHSTPLAAWQRQFASSYLLPLAATIRRGMLWLLLILDLATFWLRPWPEPEEGPPGRAACQGKWIGFEANAVRRVVDAFNVNGNVGLINDSISSGLHGTDRAFHTHLTARIGCRDARIARRGIVFAALRGVGPAVVIYPGSCSRGTIFWDG